MIDHIMIHVSYVEEAKEFYSMALAPLDYEMIWEMKTWLAFGQGDKPNFLLKAGSKNTPPVHVAFRAESRLMVRTFYNAAIAAGGKDNGPPGIRHDYHPNYYAAFILDPDGNNIEAVCHDPE